MTAFTFDDDGTRIPFNPRTAADSIAGCFLCGARVTAVGVFIPSTDVMRAVLLRLRRHAVPVRSTSAIAYGLCARHLKQKRVTDDVEAALIAAAKKVRLQ